MTARKEKKLTQKDHIQQVGRAKFDAAVARAMVVIKGDARFVGLDQIRKEIATEAALRATGYPERPFTPSKHCGPPVAKTQDAINVLLPIATEAARAGLA